MSIEQPDVPSFDELEEILEEIRFMQERISILTATLDDLAFKIASECKNEDEVLQAMKYIYWFVQEIKSATIAKIIGVKSANLVGKKLGGIDSGIICEKCNEVVPISARTVLNELLKNTNRSVKCEKCKKGEENDRWKEREHQKVINQNRSRELRNMPYHEYLKSPEWKARREKQLKSCGYRCQVCNISGSEKVLHVHHRTYERRGNEYYSDLTVLCEDCHRLFHFPKSEDTDI